MDTLLDAARRDHCDSAGWMIWQVLVRRRCRRGHSNGVDFEMVMIRMREWQSSFTAFNYAASRIGWLYFESVRIFTHENVCCCKLHISRSFYYIERISLHRIHTIIIVLIVSIPDTLKTQHMTKIYWNFLFMIKSVDQSTIHFLKNNIIIEKYIKTKVTINKTKNRSMG